MSYYTFYSEVLNRFRAFYNILLISLKVISLTTASVQFQILRMKPANLRLPSRAWKVRLIGEAADDAGGVFDDTITEMCQVNSILIATLVFCPQSFKYRFYCTCITG